MGLPCISPASASLAAPRLRSVAARSKETGVPRASSTSVINDDIIVAPGSSVSTDDINVAPGRSAVFDDINVAPGRSAVTGDINVAPGRSAVTGDINVAPGRSVSTVIDCMLVIIDITAACSRADYMCVINEVTGCLSIHVITAVSITAD
ncbi:hypothetical protein EYF80_009847 [Liparis tanakae]|uniref:Uncharacterized protein n=1 Tax=Liparis tanakae TaxID=230148 RepID=A0A4Z2IP70_9TELE|nr:hypothetical protein EYF80_009847 [Liparis tanakae]